jgi:formylglycine-generating enzyme required for sulfatase activity
MIESLGQKKETKSESQKNMAFIPGGKFMMGADKFYPEEKPVHEVTVDGFWIDKFTVTNKEFKDFITTTNYITVAERPLDPKDYPGAKPELLVPGALVFKKSNKPVDLKSYFNWWEWDAGCKLETSKRTGEQS